jgi:hypothetical protein
MGRSTSASVACVSDQMPFPHRSPRRSSANAAWGGLKPPTAGRLRRANLHLMHSTMSSLKGRGFVKTLVTWDCAGFRPPCRRHPVRAGVKTERPQRKRGRTVLMPGRRRCMLSSDAGRSAAGCVVVGPSPSRDGADMLGQGRIGPAAGHPFAQLLWAWSGARQHAGSIKRATTPRVRGSDN